MSKKLKFVIVLGVLLASVTALGLRFKPSSSPGRLVADEATVLWRSPNVELGHQLAHAKARFQLANTGGQFVKIVAIGSGCECAKPVPSTLSVGPGRSVSIDVEGTPFPIGDRTVPITVTTDSTETPTIALHLRMIGARKPPFLLDASGELAFLDVERSRLVHGGEGRKIAVRMIEHESTGREPTFRLDPPSLVIEKLSSTTKPYMDAGTVVRTHVYLVSFTEPPIESRIAGTVSVVDPWFEGHVTNLNVYAEIRDRIKAVPSRVELSIGEGADASAEFLILTTGVDPIPVDQFRIEVEGPFRVEPIASKGVAARLRIVAMLPIGPDLIAGKLTIRAPSIVGESAVVIVAARKAKP